MLLHIVILNFPFSRLIRPENKNSFKFLRMILLVSLYFILFSHLEAWFSSTISRTLPRLEKWGGRRTWQGKGKEIFTTQPRNTLTFFTFYFYTLYLYNVYIITFYTFYFCTLYPNFFSVTYSDYFNLILWLIFFCSVSHHPNFWAFCKLT